MAGPLSLQDARAQVLATALPLVEVERVPLGRACGRYLAAAIHSDGEWPATDRSAMDGFALAAGASGLPAGSELPVVGESLAGAPFAGVVPAGAAVRIMTGAVVPAGADTVVPVEASSGFGGARVTFPLAVAAGLNIRRRGSELAAGQRVLAAGHRIDAAAVGVLAVLGYQEVVVLRRPRVAIVATGDEVVPITETPAPHQVRESNSWALAAQIEACGGEALRLGIAPDEPVALQRLLGQGLATADVLVTIGGVSKGTHDLVHGALAALGMQTVFHGIDLKPGKPTLFGTIASGAAATDAPRWVFGLPGNPASTFTVFDLLVRPLLLRLAGGEAGDWTATAKVSTGWKTNSRLQASVARLRFGADAKVAVELLRSSASGDPFALLHGDVYALIPGQVPGQVAPGAEVTVSIVGRADGVRLP
ncbi:MAG: molybdopterin molybdotransferase MoeA [Planctomycetes bacterium]|nr:molybdopterin molybdotransferase MoeA [Planctomycetota bacterium]